MLSAGRHPALALSRRLQLLLKTSTSTSIHPSIFTPRLASSKMSSSNHGTTTARKKHDGPIKFGPFEVTDQVFLATPHSFALVNLKPLTPGHVLVCPLRPHPRLTDLSAPETADLFSVVQLAQRMLARAYFRDPDPGTGGSFTVAVQDGKEAGQTVPHVHVHVIPRLRYEERTTEEARRQAPDEVYVEMASERGNVGGALWDAWRERPVPGGGMPRIEDEERAARSKGEMNAEAERYRRMLREMGVHDSTEG